MKVPFLNLKPQYESIKDEIDEAVARVIENSSFAGGPSVEKFEEEFAAYCHAHYAVGCGSGTDALQLALMAAGIGPGDEVITVPNTFIATVEAICLSGAKPVLVDVKEDDFTMNPELLESVITEKTKAVIPVHLYGHTADMDGIMDIAMRHELLVIEDACQAHGSEYKGRKAGSLGHIACFSFYPGKNLGAFGEAGALVTDNHEYYEKAKMLRDHGQSRKYYHDCIGWNSRMDGLQGAVLSVKLKYLDEWNSKRSDLASIYNIALTDLREVRHPLWQMDNKPNNHLYPILVKNRDEILAEMKKLDIHCGIHYPIPIHKQQALSFSMDSEISFPVSEYNAERELSLPMWPFMSDDQIYETINALKLLISPT